MNRYAGNEEESSRAWQRSAGGAHSSASER
jgi:hypothetical protein